MSFAVGSGVLIPRPETEKIIELVKEQLQSQLTQQSSNSNLSFIDLGCGSGAISIGIAKQIQELSISNNCLKNSKVYAIDISETATNYTKQNAKKNGVESIVDIFLGDWCSPLRGSGLEGKIFGVVSNPPYISSKEMQSLQSEVGQHEPWLALDGGISGMDSILKVISAAEKMLYKSGFLIIETGGELQCKEIKNLCLDSQRWSQIEIVQDCYGKERFVMARYSR
eukprot:TRINITY_DN6413_c1_g1_i2.p1 TRINITY_DN6413_c1_g1~~TRINITY_DN6413_c1_g1_i2.p1  ORF type:complete len:225 (-),score=35.33 TRINITY_DN6413_c1_g1_i2:157-831(-)